MGKHLYSRDDLPAGPSKAGKRGTYMLRTEGGRTLFEQWSQLLTEANSRGVDGQEIICIEIEKEPNGAIGIYVAYQDVAR